MAEGGYEIHMLWSTVPFSQGQPPVTRAPQVRGAGQRPQIPGGVSKAKGLKESGC